MRPDREQEWADRPWETAANDAWEPTYRDGAVQNECWAAKDYTGRAEGGKTPASGRTGHFPESGDDAADWEDEA